LAACEQGPEKLLLSQEWLDTRADKEIACKGRRTAAARARGGSTMWETLEQTGWVKTFGSTGWMYASVSVVHYLTMFWFIGSMAVVDLRVMGLAARRRNLSELAEQIFPWAWTGLVLAVISGFFMFATDAGDWAPDPVFHWKLGLIVISIVFAILVQRGAPKWAAAPEIPTSAKVIAAIALLLWIVTILSASEIPAMEGLG
jgi:amino acid transporter